MRMGDASSRYRYFEDLHIGETCVTAGRTITESDIVNFSGVSGDFASIVMDAEYMRSTVFQGPVAHGLLGLAIADALKSQSDFGLLVHGIAPLGWTWDFRKPIRPGDTVRARFTIVEKQAEADHGIVTLRGELLNQRGEIVQEGRHRCRVRRQPVKEGSN